MDNLSNRARRLELRIALAVAAVAGICVSAPMAVAQDSNEWQGSPGTVGDWFDPANWTSGVPYTQLFSTAIDNNGTAKISAGSAAAGLLRVGQDHSGTLILDAGRLDLTYTLFLGDSAGSQGTVKMNGGALKVQSLQAGLNFGSGNILQNNGSVDALFLELGGHGTWGGYGEPTDFGKGEYRLVKGTLNSMQFLVGDAGVGTFRQSGGAVTVSTQLKVGGAVGSQPAPDWGSPILFLGEDPSAFATNIVSNAGLALNSTPISTSGFFPPPTPSVGLYELTSGSLTSTNLLVDHTGTFRQSGGNHQERSIQIDAGGRYEFKGGTLNIASGLNIDGAFDFGHTSSKLQAGSAILDLTHGLANAEHARIQAGPESLTIFAPGFRPQRDLGSFQTQGLTHIAGTDLVLHAGQRFRGWGAIDDKVIAAGSIIADDGNGLGGISLNDGLVLKPGADLDLEQGQVFVKDDQTAILGGRLKASAINVVGTTYYNPAAVTHGPNGDTYTFQPPTVTPGVARQTAGTVQLDTLRIETGRYVINDGDLHAGTIFVGGITNFNPSLVSSRFVQNGGRVETDSVSLAPAFAYILTLDVTNRANAVSNANFGGLPIDVGSIPHPTSPPTVQSYEMRGGSLVANRIYLDGGFNNTPARFHQTGGDVEVKQAVEIVGSNNDYTMEGGSLHARRIEVGSRYDYFPIPPMSLGTFAILDHSSKINISGELLLGSGGHFSAPNGATIHFTRPVPLNDWPIITGDSLAINTTNSDDVAGLGMFKLIFEGGLDSTATLEAASRDIGSGDLGYLHNFVLGTLQVGGIEPAKLLLVQNFDNQPGSGGEAVYVDRLIVRPGSVLDLGGIHLYYHSADIAPGAIVNGAMLRVAAIPEAGTAILAALALYFGAIPMARRRRF